MSSILNLSEGKILSVIVILSIAGCSTNQYRRIEAEPIRVTADTKGVAPIGIVEEAMRIQRSVHLFDEVTYKRLEEAAKSSKDQATIQANIRNALCDGSRPRTQPKLTVHLVLNKPIPGTPLDEAAGKNRLFINQTEIYLRRYWLDEGSRTDLIGKTYNSDFEQYEKNMVETNMERKFSSSRISVGVPFISGDSIKDVETYFANAHAIPNLKPLLDPTQWFPSRSYLSVAFPKEHYFVLSSKVSDLLIGVYGQKVYGTEMETEIDHDVQLTPTTTYRYFSQQDGFNFRNSAHYALGGTWKLSDGTRGQILVQSWLEDLAILKFMYSWKIPKEDLTRLFHIPADDSNALQYYGYNFESRQYSASLALEHQGTMWTRMLENQTELSSSSKEDGSILYEMKPDFSAFCKWAVPINALKSE